MTEKIKVFNDKMNQAILHELRQNARISWQALGKRVHLSGQAVAERVRLMQTQGIIAGFGIREHRTRHFITVMMTHTDFGRFERFLGTCEHIESVDKVSGDGCYLIVYANDDNKQLDTF